MSALAAVRQVEPGAQCSRKHGLVALRGETLAVGTSVTCGMAAGCHEVARPAAAGQGSRMLVSWLERVSSPGVATWAPARPAPEDRWEIVAIVRSEKSALCSGRTESRCCRWTSTGRHAGLLQSAADDATIAYSRRHPTARHGSPARGLPRVTGRCPACRPALHEHDRRVRRHRWRAGGRGHRGRAVERSLPQEGRCRQLAKDWCASRGVRCVILRVPGIYGPDRLPLERLRRDEPAVRPDDAGPGNRIHVDDLVAACVAALERPVTGAFNVCDGDYSSTTVFCSDRSPRRPAAPRLVSMDEARGQISPGCSRTWWNPAVSITGACSTTRRAACLPGP